MRTGTHVGFTALLYEAWEADAACLWARPDPRPDFFASPGTALEQRALRFCGRCPVREACLRLALSYDERVDTDGVWGGTNKRQRSRTRHLAECTSRKSHRACRPVDERLEMILGPRKEVAA